MQLRERSRRLCGAVPIWARSGVTSGKSARVMTALTPGSAAAFAVSMPTMRACAWGLRLILPHSMPGITMSAPKLARPDRAGPDDLEARLVEITHRILPSPCAPIAPSPPSGERVGVRGRIPERLADTHLTLPALRAGPLPLPPKGRRGARCGPFTLMLPRALQRRRQARRG